MSYIFKRYVVLNFLDFSQIFNLIFIDFIPYFKSKKGFLSIEIAG